MELEPATNIAPPVPDRRPLMPPPPPVRVIAVEDVRVPAPAGCESDLDSFYIAILHFDRSDESPEGQIVYRAENVRLIFDIVEAPVERSHMRPIIVEVPLLADVEASFLEAELPYQRVRGLLAGAEALLLLDPAGNWISISESRGVR